jgi:hypothetical protein
MVPNRIMLFAVATVTWLGADAGFAVAQAPDWIGELPTVEQVKKSTPAGKDERETAVRQSAAFVVWQDAIEAFTKKSFFDLRNADHSAPEVRRYFEYSVASTIDNQQGHVVDAVIAYSDTFPFRREVLGGFLSARSLQTYWDLRRADLLARQARHNAFAAQRAAAAMQSSKPAAVQSETSDSRPAASAAPEDNTAELASRDLARAKSPAALEVFGIPLGRPLKLPKCESSNIFEVKRVCVDEGDLNGVRILFPVKEFPRWVNPEVQAVTKNSVLVGLSLHGSQSGEMYDALTEKYGKPTSVRTRTFSNGYGLTANGKDWEWVLPGVHVAFDLQQDQGELSGRLGTLTIELESVYRSRASKQADDQAKRRKL